MLSDISIARLSQTLGMIKPFHNESVSRLEDGTPITSCGLSSYGYDLSLGPTYRRMKTTQELWEEGWNLNGRFQKQLVMDPCNFNPAFYTEVLQIPDEGLILMPGDFILSVSNEYINMPSDVSAICMQKSTCARTQLRVEVTPLEAGWSGFVTYEICNPTPHPVLLRKGMGITQALFFVGDKPCSTTYEDRGGKYQNQPQEPVIPRSKQKPVRGYPYLVLENNTVVLKHLDLQVETEKKPTPAEKAAAKVKECFKGISSEDLKQPVAGHALEQEMGRIFNEMLEDIRGQEIEKQYNQQKQERLAKAPVGVTVEQAMAVIAKAIHEDQDYAWTWLCNLAMMAQDAGAANAEANKRAANFLYNIFGYRAWAVNDTYKEHIKAGQQVSFSENCIRHGLDEKAVQDLISSTRANGFTTGAKPGSTAAKLGILPEKHEQISYACYLTDTDSKERMDEINRLIEKVRRGELIDMLIMKLPV